MRLGDLDVLKETIAKIYIAYDGFNPNDLGRFAERVDELIDNAPTVEPEIKEVPIAYITFDEEKLKELTDEIVDRIKRGEIVLKDERPQGEWIKVKEYRMCIDMSGEIATLYKCSVCGRTITILPSKLVDYPFCHCGAAMQKGGENNGNT